MNDSDHALVDRYVEGFRRTPHATTDEWEDLAGDHQRAGVELGHRLDAEEDAAHLTW